MIGAPAHSHMDVPFASGTEALGAQGPRSGAGHGPEHPQGHRRHLKAQDDPHPKAGNGTHSGAGNGTHPAATGSARAPMPAMGPHAMHQGRSMAPAHGLHAAAPRPVDEPEDGDVHGRNLAATAAEDPMDGHSGQQLPSSECVTQAQRQAIFRRTLP